MDVKYILIFVYVFGWAIGTNKNPVNLNVFVNSNKIYKGSTIYYNEGDNITFICELSTKKTKDYIITVAHERVGLDNITQKSTFVSIIIYKIKGDEVDNESKIYCNMRTSKYYKYGSPVKLIMKDSGQKNNSIPKIEYFKDDSTTTCNETDSMIQKVNGTYVYRKRIITLKPPDSDSIIFCENIVNTEMRKDNYTFYVLTRTIYNKIIYTWKKANLDIVTQDIEYKNDKPGNAFSFQKPALVMWIWYTIGAGVALLIILVVGIILLLRKKSQEKPPYDVASDSIENIELNPASNQIIYAELQLPEKSSYTHRFQNINEPHYAQIVNVIK